MKKLISISLALVVCWLMASPVKAQEAFGFVSSLPVGQVGVVYPTTLLTDGGVGPFNCTTQIPSLPAGLSMDTTPNLKGTPQVAFNDEITFTCMSGDGGGSTASLLLTINPISPNPVSTGKMTADVGKIKVVGSNYIAVDNKIVRLTSRTVIVKLRKEFSLSVGTYVAYVGMKNTDGTVTATGIVVGK